MPFLHSESYDPTMQVIGGTTVAYSGIGIVLSGVKRHKSQVSSVKSQVVQVSQKVRCHKCQVSNCLI